MARYFFRTLEKNVNSSVWETELDFPNELTAFSEARGALIDMAKEKLRDPSISLLQIELFDANRDILTTIKLTIEEDAARQPLM